jgi:integrase
MSSIILYKKDKLDEVGYIVLQYTKENKTKRKSLKFKMTQKDFDKTFDKEFKRFKRTTLFDYQRINHLIDENINLDVFNDVIVYNDTFLSYIKKCKDLKTNISTIKSYESSYNLLETYLKSINRLDVKITDINKDFVIKFKNYLSDGSKLQSTIKSYFNVYKTIFNKSIEDNLYNYSNPFNKVDFKITIKKKRVLNSLDLDKMIMLDFDNKYFIESRLFLLQFFLNGSRLSDVMLLKNSDIGYDEINLIMLKTKQNIPIEMSNEIRRLLYEIIFKTHYRGSEDTSKLYRYLKTNSKDYLFKDYINSDLFNDYDKKTHFNLTQYKHYKVLIVRYNNNLKKLCKKLELSEIVSSHNSRHTFTNEILKLPNVNVNDVRMMLGHSNLQTTQSYITLGFKSEKSREIQKEYRKQFSNILDSKEHLQKETTKQEMLKDYLESKKLNNVEIIYEKKDKPKRPPII